MNIDWGTAPKWAYAYARIIYERDTSARDFAWICRDGYRVALQNDTRQECWPFSEGTFTADRFRILEFRPAPSAWAGEGWPPAGTTCEILAFGRPWEQATILYFGDACCVWKSPGDAERGADVINLRFRPLRTPEQIAAEEQLNSAIALYGAVMNHSGSAFDRLPKERQEHYLKLVDEGWRKVPGA